jgi:hypothetical protein
VGGDETSFFCGALPQGVSPSSSSSSSSWWLLASSTLGSLPGSFSIFCGFVALLFFVFYFVRQKKKIKVLRESFGLCKVAVFRVERR